MLKRFKYYKHSVPQLSSIIMTVTLKKIAAELNLSPTLVSQVINGKASQTRIKKETELRVLKKAKEMQYVPNKIAQGLRLKKTNTIALITPDVSNPFFAQITRIIQNKLRLLGYNLMIFGSNDDTNREIDEIKLIESNGIDGIIIIPVGDEYAHIEKLLNKNFPLVLLYRTFNELSASSIIVDNYSSVFNIVSKLIKKGHTKIGLLQGKANQFTNSERIRGYKDGLKKYKIKYIGNYIYSAGFSRESGYSGTKELLELSTPPSVLITTSDFLTLGALQVISEKKLKTPEDIALIGFDSIRINKSLSIPISTVHPPEKKLGKMAVKVLMEEINSKGTNEKITTILKSELNISESCL